MLITSQYSSDSLINRNLFYTIINDEQKLLLEKKLAILKSNIGEDLYNKLTYKQRNFITKVSGTINLGKNINSESFLEDAEA